MAESDPLRRALALLELSPRRLTRAATAGIASLGSGLALATLAAWLIARAWQMPPVLDLSVAVVAVRALGISRGLCRYLERLASHDAALRGATAARVAMYAKLAVGNPAAVTRLRRGDLLARTGEDIDTFAAVVVRAFIPIVVAVAVSSAAVLIVGTISIAAATVLGLSLLFAGVLAPILAARAARVSENATSAANVEFASACSIALDHAAELRVAGRLDAVVDDARTAARDVVVATDRSSAATAFAAAAMPLAIGASLLAAVSIGVATYGTGAMTPMALAILVMVPLAAFDAVGPLPAAAIALTRGRIAARRVLSLLDGAHEPERAQDKSTLRLPDETTLEASHVQFGWAGQPIGEVDLELAPGSRVAVVGPSGSGKTTLLMTLAGLLEPVEGTVTLGGAPIGELDATAVRRRVTFFAEDGHLFETSLLENLRVARGDLTAEQAAWALGDVGLGRWLDELPHGLDTQLIGGDRAVSGGQRRRILLARALVSPADILLLDEPTEHLDAAGGAELLRSLLDRNSGLLARDRSVVLVTHQLPDAHSADEVVRVGGVVARTPV